MTDDPTESERLRVYYAGLPEEELLHVGSQYDSLTESAQVAVRAEFDRRGLPAPEAAEPELREFQNFVTIRQYRDLTEAMVAKSVLDSAGIAAVLRDENIIRIHWAWSNAIGGIRLQIRQEDAEAAEEVLSQPIPAIIETGDGSYQQPTCPYCQSLDVGFDFMNEKIGYSSTFLAVPIPRPENSWKCHTCGCEWKSTDDSSAAPATE
jgi:hypothetical protein